MNIVYRVNPIFNYSIRGWHKEVIPIEDKLSYWRSEVVRWFNKWTEGPHKQLLMYWCTQVILSFILQLIGYINYVIKFINFNLIYFNTNRI